MTLNIQILNLIFNRRLTMNIENFNEKYDREYTEQAVEIYKYAKFDNWFKVLKDIFSYTHNAIYSGGKEFHIIFSNKCNSEKIKITVTNRLNDLLVTYETSDMSFVKVFPNLVENEIFYSLEETYYYLMVFLEIITDYSKFTPLALPELIDKKKKKINWLHATRYIAGIKYHYKEV